MHDGIQASSEKGLEIYSSLYSKFPFDEYVNGLDWNLGIQNYQKD